MEMASGKTWQSPGSPTSLHPWPRGLFVEFCKIYAWQQVKIGRSCAAVEVKFVGAPPPPPLILLLLMLLRLLPVSHMAGWQSNSHINLMRQQAKEMCPPPARLLTMT